ncbi:MAG: hypothetical protein DMD97_03865 [Candidatus Rokuibacteriota bacterium]|nr:MAG: hypothetical protein DMD97_03865 [Candidatus Rokubacteria bacterium]
MPVLVVSVPQLPLPTPVVKLNWDGCGLRPQQVWSVVVVVTASVVVVTASVVVVAASVVVVAASVVVVAVSVVVVTASVVVVGVWVVVVVVVGQGDDCGWQRSVMSVRESPAFAWIRHVPFFVRTLTPAKFPHTALVPLALTLSFPIPPQWPLAWIRLFLRSFGVQLSAAWFTHSASSKVHVLPAAVAQSELASATRPLVCS